ncbi:MAG: tetratricopeptide repeat protein, partial [Candidatus Pacebacteria bacterium]|nr:tetratricopeptide repeat protein [Candidatus Paceibacterota bacterium]
SIAFLPPLVRFSGLLWTFTALAWLSFSSALKTARTHTPAIKNQTECPVKPFLKRGTLTASLYILGILIAALPVSVYNYLCCGVIAPISAPFEYVFTVGRQAAPTTLDRPEPQPYRNTPRGKKERRPVATVAAGYARKVTALFRAYEVTNNVNYYFVKPLLFPLNYLIGPMALLPLANVGLLLIVLRQRLLRKEGILWLYLFAFVVPICVFVPLGRYRLILLPTFCLAAVYALGYVHTTLRHRKGWLRPLAIAMLYVAIAAWAVPREIPVRDEDFVALGLALEQKGQDVKALECYRTALRLDPDSRGGVGNYARLQLKARNYSEARTVIAPFYRQNPADWDIAITYALACVYSGHPAEAEDALKHFAPENLQPSRLFDLYFYLGEAHRKREMTETAAALYEKALDAAATESQKKVAQQRLQTIK